jgi:hypothetical protein
MGEAATPASPIFCVFASYGLPDIGNSGLFFCIYLIIVLLKNKEVKIFRKLPNH